MHDAERFRLLEEEAERLTALLVDRGATLVIAFGSLARGRVSRRSDVDLIAVMNSDLPFVKRLDRLYTEFAATFRSGSARVYT